MHIKTVIYSAILSLLASISMADTHHQNPEKFTSKKISNNITMLQGKGGNLAVLTGEQGILLVDDDYKAMSSALEKTLNPYGGSKKLAYIINTHWHGDHTEGNLTLGKYSPIIAHDNVRKRLLNAQEIKLFKMKSQPYPEYALPSITFTQSLTLHINNETVKLLHYAGGHTDGDAVVFFEKANIVHTGDHFFNGIYPFVDLEHGGNVLILAKNVKSILEVINDKTQIIPGHGPLADKKDLQAFHAMLIGTSAEIKTLKDKGLSLQESQDKGLSKKWALWSKGFLSEAVWISLVYQSL